MNFLFQARLRANAMAISTEFITTPFYLCRGINAGNREQVIHALKNCIRCKSNDTRIELAMAPAGHCHKLTFSCLHCGIRTDLAETDTYSVEDTPPEPLDAPSAGFSQEDVDLRAIPQIPLQSANQRIQMNLPGARARLVGHKAFDQDGVLDEKKRVYLTNRVKRRRAERQRQRDERVAQLGPVLYRWRVNLAKGGTWKEILDLCRSQTQPSGYNMKMLSDFFEAHLIHEAGNAPSKQQPDPLQLEAANLWLAKERAECTKEFQEQFTAICAADQQRNPRPAPASPFLRPPPNRVGL
ncbi:unnamed protein product, partial [Mesorhabditis spiculigera]